MRHVSAREAHKILLANGFVMVSGKGRNGSGHLTYKHPDGRMTNMVDWRASKKGKDFGVEPSLKRVGIRV